MENGSDSLERSGKVHFVTLLDNGSEYVLVVGRGWVHKGREFAELLNDVEEIGGTRLGSTALRGRLYPRTLQITVRHCFGL